MAFFASSLALVSLSLVTSFFFSVDVSVRCGVIDRLFSGFLAFSTASFAFVLTSSGKSELSMASLAFSAAVSMSCLAFDLIAPFTSAFTFGRPLFCRIDSLNICCGIDGFFCRICCLFRLFRIVSSVSVNSLLLNFSSIAVSLAALASSMAFFASSLAFGKSIACLPASFSVLTSASVVALSIACLAALWLSLLRLLLLF
ncbi:hypothetical protein H1220_01960 [Carnobacteriaceae bacterium zg-84]|nr:hypothetical protein H1220_01960 [Carnobacteriaceae bacterium zg-84]